MNVVAVTSCPSGVAHTYMAAEAIEKACKSAGHNVKVETQGSIGVENELTKAEIEKANFVVLTKDVAIKGEDRFKGKTIVRVSAGNAIKKADALVKKLEEHYEKNSK